MAYGILIKNNDGDTVIDADHPVLCVKQTFSLTTTGFVDGAYRFSYAFGGVTATEVPLFKLALGQWVGFGAGTVVSNQATLAGARMDIPENIAAPSGFGAAVFDAAGDVMWSHNVAAGYITDGLHLDVPADDFDEGWTGVLTGNAICFYGGAWRYVFATGISYGVVAEQNLADQIVLYYRQIQDGPDSPGTTGSAYGASSVFAIAGRLA